MPWSLFSPAEWDKVMNNNMDSSAESPLSVWQHTCKEIIRILSDMISSVEFIRHLTTSNSSRKISSATEEEKNAVVEYLDDGMIETHLVELRKVVISLVIVS